MEVEIGELSSSVRVTDTEALLSSSVRAELARELLRAIDERQACRERQRAERRVSGGVREEEQQDRG
jgi:hypothetical protein